ncbi:MAG: hypothetical protein FD143_2518, partial [Ignavibacteria bacterium]
SENKFYLFASRGGEFDPRPPIFVPYGIISGGLKTSKRAYTFLNFNIEVFYLQKLIDHHNAYFDVCDFNLQMN